MKSHQILLKTSLVLLVLTSRHLIAQGNLVVNGGFDTDISGWTLTDVSANWGYVSKGGNPGGQIVLEGDFNTIPTISQTIMSLTIGSIYIISGDYYEGSVSSTGDSFGAAIDGNFLFEATSPGDTYWHSFSFYYTATSTSVLLSLSSQLNETGIPYGIDNISMYAVPEPSPSWLLLLGGGVLFYIRACNHKAVK